MGFAQPASFFQLFCSSPFFASAQTSSPLLRPPAFRQRRPLRRNRSTSTRRSTPIWPRCRRRSAPAPMPISKAAIGCFCGTSFRTVFVMWLLLHFRWSARMRDLAERITRFRPLQTALYWIQFIVVTSVLTFPDDRLRRLFPRAQVWPAESDLRSVDARSDGWAGRRRGAGSHPHGAAVLGWCDGWERTGGCGAQL